MSDFPNMRCPNCNVDFIWSGDHMFEDYGMDGDGIVSNLCCSNPDCEIWILLYNPFKEESNGNKN